MRTVPSTISLLAALLACAAGFAQPINSFEDANAIPGGGAIIERVQEHVTDGEWAIKATFRGNDKDTWPGVNFNFDEDTTTKQVFAFDAFNPGKAPVPLSYRIDFAVGEPHFGAASVAPGGPHLVEIWVSGLPRITRVFPYLRMPRTNHVLFIDNVRWATLEQRFTALRYVDDNTPPEPTPADSARGFIPFRRALTDVVFANSVPLTSERLGSVDVFATPGEYEPATLSLYALRDLKGVRVSFDGIPAEGEVLPVRALNKRVTYSSDQFIKDMPVLCERRASVDIAAGSSKRFVIELRVADNAPPGIHQGTVTVQAEGAEPVEIPLRLRVLPFTLQEPTDMFWGEYYTGPKLANTDEEKKATLERDMIDMRNHGMSSVGLCFGAPLEGVVWAEDKTCTVNLDGASLYERFMDLYRDLGYPMPVILLSDSGQSAASLDQKYAVDSEEWGQRYKNFWIAMQAIHREHNWPEVIVQPVDEPGWQDQAARDRNLRCLKLLKQIPGMRTEQDGPGDSYFHHEAGPWADVWNYNGAISDRETVRKAQADGHIITLYNCDVESYRPEVDRYVAGWFQLAAGVSGCYNWAYISYNGSPYDDLDHKTGTWMHVYPPYLNEPGGPSTGWIGTREGVDDYRYVHTLKQAIARARLLDEEGARIAADKAEAELAAIIDSLDYSPRVRSAARWTEERAGQGGDKIISGTLKLPNGWEHGEYEKARWRVARATLDLLAALGELPAEVKGDSAESEPIPLVSSMRWLDPPSAKTSQAAPKVDRQVSIPVAQGAPVLDGVLEDGFWGTAATLEPFALATGIGKPEMPTDVRAVSDGRNLYLGIVCHEDKMDYLTAGITQEGGPVWQDDCIEVFVDGNLDRTTFRQIMVNSLGVQAWNNTAQARWTAKSKAAVKRERDRWTVELLVPLADLGITGSQFGFNVCRERRPMEVMELSCWSPTGGSFGAPERFGLASLGQAWIGALSVPEAKLGANSFSTTVLNQTNAAVTLSAVLLERRGEKVSQRTLQEKIELAPGGKMERTWQYEVAGEQAPTLTLRLLSADGKTVAERSFTPSVLAPLGMRVRPRTYYLSENLADASLEINLSSDLARDSALTLAIYEPASGEIIRHQRIAPIEKGRLQVTLDLRGLPEGGYEAWALLDGPDGTRIAEEITTLVRLRGPFD